MGEKKVTNVALIVEEMLTGGQSVEDIANRIIAKRPEAKVSAIKSQIKGIMRLVKEAKKAKWLGYSLVADGIGLVKKSEDAKEEAATE